MVLSKMHLSAKLNGIPLVVKQIEEIAAKDQKDFPSMYIDYCSRTITGSKRDEIGKGHEL